MEAAWSYRYTPKVSRLIETRAQSIAPEMRALAWQAQLRLTRKFCRLRARGKHSNVIVTAVARELAGFVWAAARQLELQTGFDFGGVG